MPHSTLYDVICSKFIFLWSIFLQFAWRAVGLTCVISRFPSCFVSPGPSHNSCPSPPPRTSQRGSPPPPLGHNFTFFPFIPLLTCFLKSFISNSSLLIFSNWSILPSSDLSHFLKPLSVLLSNKVWNTIVIIISTTLTHHAGV